MGARPVPGNVRCSVMTVCLLAGKPFDLDAPLVAQKSGDRWYDKP